MSESADALRAAAAILLSKASELDGQGPAVPGFDVTNWRTWWPAMLAQYDNDGKPHSWVDWVAGVPPDQVGDNDKPDDDLLRAFGPFCQAATREQQKDSTGAVFFIPNIKKRAGIGPKSWDVVRDEIRELWFSPWGMAWRAHPLNATITPKPEVVDTLFSKVY